MENMPVAQEIDFMKSLDLMVSETEQMKIMSKRLSAVPAYGKFKEEGVFAILTAAKLLNVHPFQALNGSLYYAAGRTGMSAELMNRLIRQRGHSVQKDPASDTTKCIVIGKRADNGDTMRVMYTIDEAKRAGLVKESGPWVAHPQAMLFARALSILARQLFPDVIAGVYSEDEVREMAHQPSKIPEIIDLEIPAPAFELTSQQIEELEALEVEMPELAKKLKTKAGVIRWENMAPELFEKTRDFLKMAISNKKSEEMKSAMEGE